MTEAPFELHPVGWVESDLVDPALAPKQGNEGGPEAWLVCRPAVSDAVRDLEVGTARRSST